MKAVELKIHPFASTYPPMDTAEMEALVADITARGLQRAIVLYQGMVLDGRNRLIACNKAGVKPEFVEYEGDDPLGHVNSLNLNRDLTGAQRAIIAARQWLLNGETKGSGRRAKDEKLQTGTMSVRDLARKFRTSHSTISQARDLLTDAPDLADQVVSCTSSLAAAYDQLQQRRREAAQKARDAERVAEFKDAVSNGELRLEEALQKAIEQEREEKEKLAAQTDARHHFLKELAEAVDWVERFLTLSDDHLTWNTTPGSPGWFDHGVTPERAEEAAGHLRRLGTILKGQKHGKARSHSQGS